MRKIGNIYNNSGGMKKIGNIHDKNFSVQPNKQNVQLQSQQSQQQGQQANDFLAKPWYKQIFTKNFAREIPRGTADVLLKQPVRTATSLAEAGYNFNPLKSITDLARGRQGTYDSFKPFSLPALGEIKTFSRNAGEVAGDVVEGKKPLSAAAWQFGEVPLSVLELAGIGKGLGRGFGAYKAAPTASQGLKQAAPEILDAFLPTTRGVKTGGKMSVKNLISHEGAPDKKAVLEWKNRIKSGKKIEPLKVIEEGDKYGIEDGKHRLQAYLELGIKDVPVKVVKPRGLINTISKSPEYSAEMTETLEGAGGYAVRHQKPLVDKAQRLIATDALKAERIATTEISDQATVMSDELLKHYDKIAQTAKQSGDVGTFEKAMSRARNLALQTDVNLRESGRAISAANRFNKQSPEGMLRTLQEIAEQKGAKLNLSNDQIFNFQRKAQDIAGIVDDRARALKTFELMDEVYDSVPGGMKDKIYEVLNLPRAIMATADLSAPLRQGIFTAARHPVKFVKNIGNMLKYAFSDKALKNLKADIVTSPNYDLYVKHKLPLTDISTSLNLREEAFISQLSEKIPVFGRIAKGSNRAYAGFLNKMRVDLFDDFVETAKLNQINDPKFFDDAARFVGSATGRGNINKLFGGNEAGKVWASFFFSPRLMSSRMSLINPVYYAKLHPAVRKEALKSLVAFVGTGTGILGLAKANGADVGTDPRSADFGKIKVGNTRYDTWGGFQQYARLIGQLATGEKISTTTGKQTELGSGFGTPTRESIIMDFFKSKEAPILSLLTRMSQGEHFGEPFRLGPEVIDRFIPMVIQDAFDLQREWGGKGIAMAAPAVFGVGSQTYGDQIPMLGTTKSNAPTIQWRQEPSLGESIYNKFTGTEISNIPKEMHDPLSEERQIEQLRRIEYDAAKARVLETGRPETVGDTYIYLQNGIPKSKKLGDNSRMPLKDKLLYEEINKRVQKTNPYFMTE
jgi:hypothetical protein